MPWDLQIDRSVLKELQKIPREDTADILKVLRLLPLNPFFGDIQKMQGKYDTWRRRVGSYRIFFVIKKDLRTILVFHLERRTSKTY